MPGRSIWPPAAFGRSTRARSWAPQGGNDRPFGGASSPAALRGEPTGAAQEFRADVVATAKRDLAAGETLDGEGGFTVYGRIMPAADSLRQRGLPLGLAHGVRLTRPVRAGGAVTFTDVEIDEASEVLRLRREMEAAFAPATAAAVAR